MADRRVHRLKPPSGELSVRETLAGKNVLLVGGTGFLGKVWLSIVLQHLPEIGRVYLLTRGKGRSPRERFEKMMGTQPVFKTLHDTHGAALAAFVVDKIEVVEGHLGDANLGMEPETARRLRRDVDVVLNFAGLVDFNPDLRDAVASNIEGALNVAEFAASCEKGRLLHVSTCYVAGERDGLIREELETDRTPNGQPLDATAELEVARGLMAKVLEEHDDPEIVDSIRGDVVERLTARGMDTKKSRVDSMVGRLRRKRTRERMAQEGTERSKELGWPNTYTYTKALAEVLLHQRFADRVPLTIFRPAIVESALHDPFPGWNEGFNTSGPLVYLAGTWFRHIHAKPGNPLDVIPVDLVCRGLLITTSALLRDEHAPVYQCGTSDLNPLPIDRLCELSALGHRRYLRKHGTTSLDRLLRARWDAVVADPEHTMNIGNVRRVVRQVNRFLRKGLPVKIPFEVRDKADDLASKGESADRRLRVIEEMLDLFQPFTHDHYFIYECRAIARHQAVEPEFRFEPEVIDWRDYWMEVHLPGLRRWCFPTYENKDIESYEPAVPFRLPPVAGAATPKEGVG